MRMPSIKTLSRVFEDPKQARAILTMNKAELSTQPAAVARIRECLHSPAWWDVRLTVLNSIDQGLHGVESIETAAGGEWASYLNTGETYADTLIYWRGAYRVQSLGNFIERSRVAFK